MSEQKTKLQKGVDYIFAHPGARSDAIAEVLDCAPSAVSAYLKDALTSGLIVSCDVKRPKGHDCKEYRPSAAAPAKAPNVRQWRAEQKARQDVRALGQTLKSAAPGMARGLPMAGFMSETPAGGGGNITGSRASESPVGAATTSPEGAVVVETQAERVMASEIGAEPPGADRPAASDVTQALPFSAVLSDAGTLQIVFGERSIILPSPAVRQLGSFLADTEPVWA